MDKLTRRSFIRVGATGALMVPLLAACSGGPPAAAPVPASTSAAAVVPAQTAADAVFDWKQFKGESLYIPFVKHPWATVAEQALPDFADLTGITVNYEDLPEIQARHKLVVEFAGGGGTLDAFVTSLHVEKVLFAKSGWYLPLNEMLAHKKLTSPELDLKDTVGPVAAITAADGRILAQPNFTDVSIMAYRKDLLEAKGIQPPQDHTQLEAAIKAVHNPPQVYGWCARGLKNANMTQWPCQFFNFGGEYVKDGKAAINSSSGEQCVDWYTRMAHDYAPPGVVNFNWYEVTAAFMQGQVAFLEDGINFFTQFEDASKSTVKGKVGYILVPKGPGGQVPPTYTSGVAVSAKTKKPGPAFLFAQWLTGKTLGIKEQLGGVGVATLSTWDDPKGKEGGSMPKEWVDTYLQGMKIGKPGLPEIAAVTQYRDDVGALLQQAIEAGSSSKDVVQKMNTAFQAILDKETTASSIKDHHRVDLSRLASRPVRQCPLLLFQTAAARAALPFARAPDQHQGRMRRSGRPIPTAAHAHHTGRRSDPPPNARTALGHRPQPQAAIV